MKRKIFFSILTMVLILILAVTALAQPGTINLTSEWEATAFNNGRRMVRDSNGYFHAFWHSLTNPNGSVGITL